MGISSTVAGDQLAGVNVYKGSVVTETGLGIGGSEMDVHATKLIQVELG